MSSTGSGLYYITLYVKTLLSLPTGTWYSVPGTLDVYTYSSEIISVHYCTNNLQKSQLWCLLFFQKNDDDKEKGVPPWQIHHHSQKSQAQCVVPMKIYLAAVHAVRDFYTTAGRSNSQG